MRHVFSTDLRPWLGRFFTLLAATLAVGSIACGEDSPSPAGPSPTVASASSTAADAALASISVTPAAAEGQSRPQGTVTLTTAAPSGGARVSLSSSNTDVAKVPSTVTVPADATQASFSIDTSSVAEPTPVTIAASYAGVTMRASLTVTGPPLVAAFTVQSPIKGFGGCVFGPDTDEADCRLDGSRSRGLIDLWVWSYSIGNNRLTHTSREAQSRLQIDTKCAFFEGGRGGDDPDGTRYVQMTIELQVQDRQGARSPVASQPARMYPNRLCGFRY